MLERMKGVINAVSERPLMHAFSVSSNWISLRCDAWVTVAYSRVDGLITKPIQYSMSENRKS